jgi:ribosomal protein S18 acetylase RimI-like enzyme
LLGEQVMEGIKWVQKTENDNRAVLQIIKKWGSDIIVTRGEIYKGEDLDGILAYKNSEIIGLGLYHIKNEECEIVLLETFEQNIGIGTQIIEKTKEIAKNRNCKRVWLITTNDNIDAIKFYQRRGFNISNFYKNAIDKSRKLKPTIPLKGNHEIPIRDEIEFEIKI